MPSSRARVSNRRRILIGLYFPVKVEYYFCRRREAFLLADSKPLGSFYVVDIDLMFHPQMKLIEAG